MPDPYVHSLPICPSIAVVCKFSLQAFRYSREGASWSQKQEQTAVCVFVGNGGGYEPKR